jgi:hypothetical protein
MSILLGTLPSDGKQVVTAGHDGTVRTWDAGTRQQGRCQLAEVLRVWDTLNGAILPNGWRSVTHSGPSDVQPGGVCFGAELSVGGGGQSVSTRAEVVGDSAEWNQKTLHVIG